MSFRLVSVILTRKLLDVNVIFYMVNPNRSLDHNMYNSYYSGIVS